MAWEGALGGGNKTIIDILGWKLCQKQEKEAQKPFVPQERNRFRELKSHSMLASVLLAFTHVFCVPGFLSFGPESIQRLTVPSEPHEESAGAHQTEYKTSSVILQVITTHFLLFVCHLTREGPNMEEFGVEE